MFTNINKVLSRFKTRPNIKNKFDKGNLEKVLKEKFGVEEVSLKSNRIEIRTTSNLLAQELSYRKEDIEREVGIVLGRGAKKKEIIIKRI